MMDRPFGRERRSWLIGAGIAVGAVALLLYLSDGRRVLGGIGWQEFLIVLLLVGAVPLLILLVANFGGGARPYILRQWAPLPPERIRTHAVRWYAEEGWTLTGGGEAGALAFRRRPPPDTGLAILLFFLGVVPLLIYLLLGGREQTTTIIPTPVPDGTDLEIVVSAKGGGGQASAERFFNSLHDLLGPGGGRKRVPARLVP